jgi:glycosyltransferase involved in cell wall biosynthesis
MSCRGDYSIWWKRATRSVAMAKVLLGVTGSVAAIKTPELYTALRTAVHEVKIVATAAALFQRHPPATDADDGVVRIGYPTTPRPGVSALLVAVVEHFLGRYGRSVIFEFIGWMPDALRGLPNVVFHPWIADYDAYLEFKVSRRWHIGIAPLIGDRFERYKTNNKYREYGGCLIPGVYSNVSPFRETVDDGKTGMLVANEAGAWIAALDKLVTSNALRSVIARAALDDVRQHYDLRSTGRQLADTILRYGAA